jgi:hypothetical protein
MFAAPELTQSIRLLVGLLLDLINLVGEQEVNTFESSGQIWIIIANILDGFR